MKKILALAMVLGVLGSVIGCSKAEEESTTPAATAGAATSGAATAGDAAAKTE